MKVLGKDMKIEDYKTCGKNDTRYNIANSNSANDYKIKITLRDFLSKIGMISGLLIRSPKPINLGNPSYHHHGTPNGNLFYDAFRSLGDT